MQKKLKELSDTEKAEIYKRFFKSGKGQYGEGDLFLGITVPKCRLIAKEFQDLELNEIEKHLKSKWHEERLIALLILVEKFKKNKDKKIVDFYLENTKFINNWDLVDLSADKILGAFFIDKDKKKLYEMALSQDLWEKRISIISTFYFIKNNKFEDTLKISKILLKDKHDLIHKAVGWMLREVGKRDIQILKDFLRENYDNLPRTTLRYAIEKFPEAERKNWLMRQGI